MPWTHRLQGRFGDWSAWGLGPRVQNPRALGLSPPLPRLAVPRQAAKVSDIPYTRELGTPPPPSHTPWALQPVLRLAGKSRECVFHKPGGLASPESRRITAGSKGPPGRPGADKGPTIIPDGRKSRGHTNLPPPASRRRRLLPYQRMCSVALALCVSSISNNRWRSLSKSLSNKSPKTWRGPGQEDESPRPPSPPSPSP